MSKAAEFTIQPPPPPVGSWRIGTSLHLYVMKRPRWLTRVMCKWLLEWEWVDAAPGGHL